MLYELLGIEKGVTAVIGGGGKTTLLRRLAEELSSGGKVVLTTTTKIYPFGEVPLATTEEELFRALKDHSAVCVGATCEGGKLTSALPMEKLTTVADFVLVEADGSRGLPMKAHADHEPAIPERVGQTILVVGASGFGRTVKSVCHRPELYAERVGATVNDKVTPEMEAELILRERLGDRLFVNQAEGKKAMESAFALAKLTGLPAVIGSLEMGIYCEA